LATTFEVIYLGTAADIDTVEGNFIAENSGALSGLTFGSEADPLRNHIQQFAPGTGGFSGTNPAGYDHNISNHENFTIDGGADQQFDMMMVYNATLTYIDGTTANITAVILQDTAGNTYLAPETSYNSDQIALEAKPIESITLGSEVFFNGNEGYGLAGDRYAATFACYTNGTLIRTPTGDVRIEELRVGDLVCTDGGDAQPIRWISGRYVIAQGKNAPVLIPAGAMGAGLPERDLRVSRQHRMLVRSRIAERMFGTHEVLIPAVKLAGLGGIRLDSTPTLLRYVHLMLDSHDIIIANGVPSESLYFGEQAVGKLPDSNCHEILDVFAELRLNPSRAIEFARPVPNARQQARLVARHLKNKRDMVEMSLR